MPVPVDCVYNVRTVREFARRVRRGIPLEDGKTRRVKRGSEYFRLLAEWATEKAVECEAIEQPAPEPEPEPVP